MDKLNIHYRFRVEILYIMKYNIIYLIECRQLYKLNKNGTIEKEIEIIGGIKMSIQTITYQNKSSIISKTGFSRFFWEYFINELLIINKTTAIRVTKLKDSI